MKLKVIAFLVFLLFFSQPRIILAIKNPTEKANNKFGVHLLDPNEIDQAVSLVNSNGGNWGYVTVPLRSDDRNREKWLKFFKKAKLRHLIPIIRLATVMTANGWARPSLYDSVDFANFLNDMPWPTQNRYVIVYNEPNHASEWGGQVDAKDYGRILNFTSQIFKERSQDFFILSAGLDAAAPNSRKTVDLYSFVDKVNRHYPYVWQKVDGWSSHSYPNPAFAGKPWDKNRQSISSFQYETAYIKKLTGKNLPVFITETGWSNKTLSDETIAYFYQLAFDSVWQDQQVMAVTPFLLLAGDGPFRQFSLLRPDQTAKPQYLAIQNIAKVRGEPEIFTTSHLAQVLGDNNTAHQNQKNTNFYRQTTLNWGGQNWQNLFSWLVLE